MEAAAEFDNRPGPVRDLVAETMGMWMDLLVEQAGRALERGELAPGTDPAQLAWELHAFGLALNWDYQLNGASPARGRAATAVRARLEAAATPKGRKRLAAPRPRCGSQARCSCFGDARTALGRRRGRLVLRGARVTAWARRSGSGRSRSPAAPRRHFIALSAINRLTRRSDRSNHREQPPPPYKPKPLPSAPRSP